MSSLYDATRLSQFNFFLQSDAGLYIGTGCFSIVAYLFLLCYKKKSIEGINAAYYLTLLTMCLQTGVAVYSAINATNSDIFIQLLLDQPYNYTISNSKIIKAI
jgi:hypothetical protein